MQARRIGLGLALIGALALHAWSMGPQNRPHMLWSCHVASAALAIGLLFNQRTLAAAGFLFHLGIGFPAWFVELIATRGTFGAAVVTPQVVATSILVHLVPLISGAVYLRRSALSATSLVVAWLFQVGMVPISRWITPPEFNVNLAHAIWRPLANTFSNFWIFQIIAAIATLAALVIMRALWNGFVAKRPQAVSAFSPRPG